MKKLSVIASLILLTLSAVAALALPNYTGFTNRSTGYVVTANTWNSEFGNLITHVNTYCIGTLNLLLSKGNLLTSDGTNIHALTNGGAADDDKVLTLDHNQTDGVKWAALPGTIIENGDCYGRLTPFSGVPVPVSTTSSASTIYFTPYRGNTIGLYESSQWHKHTFSEITISLSGTLANTNYDVFIYDSDANTTADAAEKVAWTDNSTRATSLATQNGVLVKTGATERRYVGTFRTTSAGTTAHDSTQRFIWNYYNRVPTFGIAGLTTDSWTYASSSWRRINGLDVTTEFVLGVKEDLVFLDHFGMAGGSGDGMVGIGVDQFTSTDADIFTEKRNSGSSEYEAISAHKYLPLDVGYHKIYALEKSLSGTTTFYGDDGGNIQTGIKITFAM